MNSCKNKITGFARLALVLLAGFVLTSCGGGGGSGASGQQPTSATSSLVVAKVDAAASPAIAVMTDNTGKEKIVIIGTKDSSGAPLSVTQGVYISASGEAGTITMGADGFPASLSDAVGNKITFTNFTDNTIDITQFDPAGNKVAGPVTVNVDPTVLAKLRANAVTLASSSTQGTSLVAGVFSGISTQDLVEISANTIGTAAGLAGCYGVIFAPVVTVASGGVAAPLAVPLFVLSASACVSTLVKAANDIKGTNRPAYITVADATAGVGDACLASWSPIGCAINIATAIVPFIVNVTAPPPSVPTGLTLSKVQANQVSFNWTGSSGSYAWISGYRVYRDGSQIADGAGTSYVDTKVSPGTRYCYTVAAHDVNRKSSGVSDQLCVTIPSAVLFVSSTTPVSGTSGTPVSSAVFATFNEAIDASTLNASTSTVIGSSGLVTGTVSYNAVTQSAVFTPSANLAYAATYTATVTTGVKDLSGNPLASNYSWNFTTASNIGGGTAPLSFTVLNPASVSTGAVGYQPTLTASGANFSNLTQIRFDWSGVTSGSATWVKGTVSWDPSKNTVYSDGLLTLKPVVTQMNDPAGLTTWTVTLTDTAGKTVTKTFTVNYTPTTSITCSLPQVLQNGVCVTLALTCTLPQVLTNGVCVTPAPATETPALSITTSSLPSATVGTGYAQNAAVSGGQTPYIWSVSSGLPNGLSLNATTGSISGTPSASGTFSFTVTTKDSSSPQKTASQTLPLIVVPPASTPPGNFTVTATPYCETTNGAPTGAVLLEWGQSSTVTNYEIVRDGTTVATGITELGARNSSSDLTGQTHSYVIRAHNSSTSTTDSNNGVAVSVTVPSNICAGNPPAAATGTLSLSPTSCVVPSGQSTCSTVYATWSTTNAATPKLVDVNTGGTLSSAASQSGFQVWVAYPQTVFSLRNGTTQLATQTATATCAAGSTWNGTSCAANAASGTLSLSPTSCVVPSGQSTCSTVYATWSTTNAATPKLVDVNTGGTLSSAASQSGFQVWVAYPQTVFSLRNGTTQLATQTATATCAAGSTWNNSSGTCVASAASPSISYVTPSQPKPTGAAQPFTINGQNFASDVTVTLRTSGGGVYANRTISSRSSTQIVINPNFGTVEDTWTVEVISPSSGSSGRFSFTVKP